MVKSRVDLLSKEFMVATQIYESNLKEEKIYFTKLVELLEGYMTQGTVMKKLRTLFDWGIVKAEFGETDKARAGRLLYIAGEESVTIKELYEKYWKDRVKKK